MYKEKNISKLWKAGFIILLLISAVGCEDFLDQEIDDQLTDEIFFSDPENTSSFLISAYATLKNGSIFDNNIGHNAITTDIQRTAGFNSQGGLGTYTHSPSNNQLAKIWDRMYGGIARCNIVLSEIEKFGDSPETRDEIGEVRFIRALYYFHLVRLFGDLPLQTERVLSQEEANIERSPVELVYSQIVSDLTYAATYCKLKSQLEEKERVSKGAAQSLLAKVLLTRGNMTDLGEMEGDAEVDYRNSMLYADSVIQSGEYALVPYFPNAFVMEGEFNNTENVFVIKYEPGPTGGAVGNAVGISKFADRGGAYNNIIGTAYAYTFFDSTDLVRRNWTVTKSSLETVPKLDGSGGELVLTSFDNPRFFANLQRAYPEVNDPNKFFFNGGDTVWQYWPPVRIAKFRRWPLTEAEQGIFQLDSWGIDDPLIRYAEVLLIFAEAANEVNQGPTGDAYSAINQVRERARNFPAAGPEFVFDAHKSGNVSLDYRADAVPDLAGLGYTSFRQAVLDERVRELTGENGCGRWYDLVRRGILVEQMTLLNTFENPLTGQPEQDWTNENGPGLNVKEFHKLMPVPQSARDKNPMLSQNPGY